MIKNAAYAWRQMVFYLSFLGDPDLGEFLGWAGAHLEAQRPGFRRRFAPALEGLRRATEGRSVASDPTPGGEEGRRFRGWSRDRHWLLD